MVRYAIYPPGKLIFNAFNLCPFDKVKVVIIGQDPYHGPGQAHGLCFSVNDGVPFPPSLVNIFKEIKTDIGTDAPPTGNLDPLGGTRRIIAQCHSHRTCPSSRLPSEPRLGNIYRCRHPYPCRRTGAFGLYIYGELMHNEKARLSIATNTLVLTSAHPSPLSAYNGFFGNKHFSKTNEYLKAHGKEEINGKAALIKRGYEKCA